MTELDPRDAVLQAHTPVLMVPRFGTPPAPLEKSGHRYLVAEDGLWLEVKRPWLSAVVPIGGAWTEHQLPFGPLEQRIAYTLKAEDLADLQRRFLVDAKAAMPNECAAWGVYDSVLGELEYHPLIAIDAGPGGIEFHRPTLGLNQHLAVDLHSHGALRAYFSETDDGDDRGEVKLAVVVGSLEETPEWATRLCLLGLFIEAGEAEVE